MYGFDVDPERFQPEDLERITEDAEGMLRRVEEVQGRLGEVIGEGAGADGLVTVTVEANGRVREVVLAPRAMRWDSKKLAAEVTSAVQRAQEDAERRTQELMSEALGEHFSPDAFEPGKFEERISRVLESFERSMDAQQESIERTRRDSR